MKDIFETIRQQVVPTHPNIDKVVTDILLYQSAAKNKIGDDADDPHPGFFESAIEERLSPGKSGLPGLALFKDNAPEGLELIGIGNKDDEVKKLMENHIDDDFLSLDSLEKKDNKKFDII